MFGFFVFYHVYRNLGENSQKKILRNIFGIYNVSVYDISLRNESVVFHFFENGVFYQYVFLFHDSNDRLLIRVGASRRIFNCLVNVDEEGHLDSLNSFSLFLELLRCQDEYQIYRMMRRLL